MKVVIGADHAGFELKESMRQELIAQGHELFDVGAFEYLKDDDYPDYAAAVAQAIVSGKGERGVLICGSGVGACIVANKVAGNLGELEKVLTRRLGAAQRSRHRSGP